MIITSNNLLLWLAALRLPEIGPVTFRRWLNLFSDIHELFSATKDDLLQIGFKETEAELFNQLDWRAIEKDAEWIQKSNCHFISWDHPAYPPHLRQVHSAPLVLFVKGNPALLLKPQLAIVGSRTPTAMGSETATQFAWRLTQSGFVITSGLALGIDAASHRGALKDGQTIAVTGTGLKHIYPAAHRKLTEEIIAKGALVSEFLPDQAPKPRNFPLRNRVISGLSLGVLVVEAALRSGSLITAHDALEQGREVFAIPGSIHNPLARGCHYLLRQGAKLVETINDILEEFQGVAKLFPSQKVTPQTSVNIAELDEKQQKIYKQIGYETTAVDTIIVRSGLTASEVSSILLSLEIKGCAQIAPGGYVRTPRKPA